MPENAQDRWLELRGDCLWRTLEDRPELDMMVEMCIHRDARAFARCAFKPCPRRKEFGQIDLGDSG